MGTIADGELSSCIETRFAGLQGCATELLARLKPITSCRFERAGLVSILQTVKAPASRVTLRRLR
jgi:hypothetical protein